MSERPRLVALRALGLGDLLTAVPALRALAVAYPGHHRMLATPRELAPLALLSGAVHEVVHARPFERLDPRLREADVAVNLHGRGPESHRLLLDARPRRLVGFAQPAVPRWGEGPEWRSGEHEVARWCRMLSESGIAADPTRLDIDPPAIHVPEALHGLTIVHPGAASAGRRWPAERFAAVARAEAGAGRRVAVTGSMAEAGLAAEVARTAGLSPEAALAGRTGLRELAALVAHAGRVVCGDTGIAHLATALGTPSVVLFGPVAPDEWGPPRERPWHRALWAGERDDPHADRPAAGLLDITVDDVLAALEALPAAGERSAEAPQGPVELHREGAAVASDPAGAA
ncbi:MAG: glycosyltransferase family 9 protein [Actinomycetota bacterium]|nr:glycosyltransferase family 9 protein [Actinomycetota bacterium]